MSISVAKKLGVVLLAIIFAQTMAACNLNNDFEEIYRLTIEKEGEGTVMPEAGEHEIEEKGTIVDLEAIPNEDWKFNYWDGNVSDPEESITTITIGRNETVIANFEKDDSSDITDDGVITSFEGHDRTVYSADFSSDASMVVSGSLDRVAKIWDANSGEMINSLSGHGSAIYSVAFSSDDSMVVTGSSDDTARLWDAESGNTLINFEEHDSRVKSVDFSKDDSMVASGSWDKTAKVWDTDTGEAIISFEEHESFVESVAFSSDDSMVVSGDGVGKIYVWNAEDGEIINTFDEHEASVRSVAFSSDDSMVVSGSTHYDEEEGEWKGMAKVWERETGNVITSFKEHYYRVHSVDFSSDDSMVVSGAGQNHPDYDGSAKVWETETGNVITSFEEHDGLVYSAVFSSDDSMVVSGSADNTVKVWKWEEN